MVTLFDSDGLLLFLLMFYNKSMVRSSYMMITMFNIYGPHVPNSYAVVTLFGVDGLLLFFMILHYKGMVGPVIIIIMVII